MIHCQWSVGDKKINCHDAREIGIASMTNHTFTDTKIKRGDQVFSLLTMSSILKVYNKKVPIDPVFLFLHEYY